MRPSPRFWACLAGALAPAIFIGVLGIIHILSQVQQACGR